MCFVVPWCNVNKSCKLCDFAFAYHGQSHKLLNQLGDIA